jgi:hypothetical protein
MTGVHHGDWYADPEFANSNPITRLPRRKEEDPSKKQGSSIRGNKEKEEIQFFLKNSTESLLF